MRYHFQEQIDEGMKTLASKQGTGGCRSSGHHVDYWPRTFPPPPPDKSAAKTLEEQDADADKTEAEVKQEAGSGGGGSH